MSLKQQQQGSIWAQLKALDAFPKVNEDFFQKTMSGGIITVVAACFMLILFLSETRMYLVTQTSHELSVDTSRGETIHINFDLEFSRMPCSWVSLDAMDVSGDMHLDVDHNIFKQRLSAAGKAISEVIKHDDVNAKTNKTTASNSTTNACASCYGAEDADHPCCNTCDQVREAYQRKGWVMSHLVDVEQCRNDNYLKSIKEQEGEGCHLWGSLLVNKVAGNFHIAAGRSYQRGSMHVHDMAPFGDKALDFSHKVHAMSFGAPYPGMKNPLDGSSSDVLVQRSVGVSASKPATGDKGAVQGVGMFQYFLKVVPTEYSDVRNKTLRTNQYSVTENFREAGDVSSGGRNLPGVFFFYDLSPIKVRIVEQRSSFLHFLTNVCAIVGGVFALSGLVDGAVHHGELLIRKKMDLGKQW